MNEVSEKQFSNTIIEALIHAYPDSPLGSMAEAFKTKGNHVFASEENAVSESWEYFMSQIIMEATGGFIGMEEDFGNAVLLYNDYSALCLKEENESIIAYSLQIPPNVYDILISQMKGKVSVKINGEWYSGKNHFTQIMQ